MATYKVLQDIEAEDKFVGPLTLKQFIFAAIAALSLYLSFIFASRGAWIILFILGPVIVVTGFLAFPWGRDQPTEVWLLAKIRFMFKPHKRIWDQSGIQELVRITAPKKIEVQLSDGLSQNEVKSRLKALAETIDSRGWAVKNANYDSASGSPVSDRLVGSETLPRVSNLVREIEEGEDIFSSSAASRLDQQISQNNQGHREQAVNSMQQVLQNVGTQPGQSNGMWFMGQPEPATATVSPQVSMASRPAFTDGATLPSYAAKPTAPTADEQAALEQIHAGGAHTQTGFRNHKSVSPVGASNAYMTNPQNHAASVTAAPDPVTIGLARNDDRTVESLARETNQLHPQNGDDEVIISLH